MGPLENLKHERFCQEYMVDYVGAAAARRSGYSANCASDTAYTILSYPEVAFRLAELQAEQAARIDLDVDYVVQALVEVAEVCLGRKPIPTHPGDAEATYRFNPNGASRALELLGKHKAMFIEKTVNLHAIDFSGASEEELEAILQQPRMH